MGKAELSKPKGLTRAYIGLGSNHGDRVGYVQQAMQLLKDFHRIEVVECSSLYETEPVGDEYSEWFVNAVAAVETDFTSEELLDVCQDIRTRLAEMHGSISGSGTGNRTKIIDLDILFFGNQIVCNGYLTLPHPQVHTRAYALVPMLEIAPDQVHPGLGKTVTEMHEQLPNPELVFLYGTRNLGEEF